MYEEFARNFVMSKWDSKCSKETNSLCKTEELINVLDMYNHYILYPNLADRKQCTLLILLNLAQPQWLSVDCNTKLMSHVVCFSTKQIIKEKKEVSNFGQMFICATTAILYKKWCYFFFEYDKSSGNNILPTCRNKGLSNILEDDSIALELFGIIAEALGEIGLNFAAINKNGTLSYLDGDKYRIKMLSIFSHRRKMSAKGKDTVFLSCKRNMIQQNIYKGLVYKHYNGYYRSVMFLHDGKQWDPEKNLMQTNTSCKPPHCTDLKCNSVFFYKSVNGNCNPYSQQEISESTNERQTLSSDIISDRGLSFADEPTNKSLLFKGRLFQCPIHHLPCNYDNSECYYFNKTCIFRLNKYSNIIPCRTGSHLQYCKNFECNVHFKCPSYYCIPWGYVCDGKWDCPNGYDESAKISCGHKRSCTSMLHCKASQICLHLENICDGYHDCPLGDDEVL